MYIKQCQTAGPIVVVSQATFLCAHKNMEAPLKIIIPAEIGSERIKGLLEHPHPRPACPGQDPGFSNRGSAMSHTHMWVWLRFCIATLYYSTRSQVKGENTLYR